MSFISNIKQKPLNPQYQQNRRRYFFPGKLVGVDENFFYVSEAKKGVYLLQGEYEKIALLMMRYEWKNNYFESPSIKIPLLVLESSLVRLKLSPHEVELYTMISMNRDPEVPQKLQTYLQAPILLVPKLLKGFQLIIASTIFDKNVPVELA